MKRWLCISITGSALSLVFSIVAIGLSASFMNKGSFGSISASSGTFSTSLTSPEITQLKASSCTWTKWVQTMGFVQLKPELGPCESQLAHKALYTYRLWTTFCGPSSPKFWSVEIVPSAIPSFSNGPGYYVVCENGTCTQHTCEYTGITLDNFIPMLPFRSGSGSVQLLQNAFIQLLTENATMNDLTGQAWTLNDGGDLSWFSQFPIPLSTTGQFVWRFENAFTLQLFTDTAPSSS